MASQIEGRHLAGITVWKHQKNAYYFLFPLIVSVLLNTKYLCLVNI